MTEIASFVSQMELHWTVLGAVAVSFLVNLLLLGLILGRGDRQSLRLVGQLRQETGRRIEDLVHCQQEMERRHRQQMEELRRALGRIELRQSHAFPLGERNGSDSRMQRKGIDKKHHVYRLASKGLDPLRIAQRLNMYEGEAELVLGLQQFMSSQRRSGQPLNFNPAGATLQ